MADEGASADPLRSRMRESEDLHVTAAAFGQALADFHEAIVRAPLDERMLALLVKLEAHARGEAEAKEGRRA
jgi:hypothetical protein